MERCLGCMNEYDASLNVCPHCGYVKGTAEKSRNHLAPGTILAERYLIGRCLGQGGFGITYIAWDQRLYKKVAIKEFMPTSLASRITGRMEITCYNEEAQARFESGIRRMLDESRRLARFNDLESVVKVYDCFEANQTAYIIMELLEGENVKTILAQRGKIELAETVKIMLPILQALREIHASGLIHRDISPDNIFVCNNGKVKLLDFGSARVASGSDDKSLSVILKPGYAPKEQYSSSAPQGPYTDVYAVCATIYKMLTGITPIDSLERRVQHDELQPIDTLVGMPRNLAQIIMQGLAVEAEDRLQTVDPIWDAFYRADVDELQKPQKLQKAKKAPVKKPGKPAAKKKTARVIALICAAALLVGAAGYGIWHKFFKDRNEPIQIEEIIEGTEYTPYQQELLQEASVEQTPSDQLPQPANRERIKSEYASSLAYTADEGRLYAEYSVEDRVLLRERITLPENEADAYTLYTYSQDGKTEAVVQYLPDGSAATAERCFYNKDGTLFAHSEYTGSALSSMQEIREYDTEQRPVVSVLQLEGGRTEYIKYSYDKTAQVEVHADENGNKVYECTRYLDGSEVRETWFTDGNEARALTKKMDAKGRITEYLEEDHRRQETRYTWRYDERTGNLVEHIVYDRNNVQTSAVKFGYKKGKLNCFVTQKGDGINDCTYYLDGRYILYSYNSKGQWIAREAFDADGKTTEKITMEYDGKGKLSRKDYYDEDGKLTQYYAEYAYSNGGESYTVFTPDGRRKTYVETYGENRSITEYNSAEKIISDISYNDNIIRYKEEREYYDDVFLKSITWTYYDEDGVQTSRETDIYYDTQDEDILILQSGTYYDENDTRRRVREKDRNDTFTLLAFYDEDGDFICRYEPDAASLLVARVLVTYADGSVRRIRAEDMEWYAEEPFM